MERKKRSSFRVPGYSGRTSTKNFTKVPNSAILSHELSTSAKVVYCMLCLECQAGIDIGSKNMHQLKDFQSGLKELVDLGFIDEITFLANQQEEE